MVDSCGRGAGGLGRALGGFQGDIKRKERGFNFRKGRWGFKRDNG